MQPTSRVAAAAFGAVVLSFAGAASAQELVVNGGFEDGLTGWAQSTFGGGCVVEPSGDFAFGGSAILSPSAGASFGAVRTVGNTSAGCSLRQNVAIPTAGSTVLNLDAGAVFNGPGSFIQVTVARPFSGTEPPVVLFAATSDSAMAAQPSFDLTPYAGDTVQITLSLSKNFANLAGGIDRVSIVNTPTPIPTLTEWVMILLGLLIAGAGVAMVQPRRPA